MAGEPLGMEGIGTGRYSGAAIVLERSEICVVPFALVQTASLRAPGAMMLLGSMRAEERLVALLLDLERFRFSCLHTRRI